MTDSNSTSTSRRSVLKIVGISLAGLTGASGVGAAQTSQNQEAVNANYQDGYASASGRNSRASVNQQSSQNISQNQRAGSRRHKKHGKKGKKHGKKGSGRTRQNQQAANVNVQVGTASASGKNSRASVNQESDQNISQNQRA